MAADTAPPRGDRRSLLVRNPANVAFLAAALILLFGGWQIERAYRTAVAEALNEVRNLSRSLAQHMERSIEGVDLILGGIVERLEEGGLSDPAAFKSFLVGRSKAAVPARNVAVLNADGEWIVSSAASEPQGVIDTTDRPYFRLHRAYEGRGLHIDNLTRGRISGKAIVPLSKRWNRPDGSFGGVVVASLNPDYFSTFYERVGVGEKGAIALISDEKRFLIRHPFDPDLASRDLSRSPLFRNAKPGAREGIMRYHSAVDGVERIAAFERLEAYPVLVLAARSFDEVLAPWRREALLQGTGLAAAAAALVGLGIGLARRERRMRAAEAAIRAAAAKQREILDSANDAFVSLDGSGLVTALNRAAERMFGWPAAEVIGRPASETFSASDAGSFLPDGEGESAGKRVERIARRRDGTAFPVEVTVSASGTGEDRAFNAFIQDISERKGRERALAESEARFRVLAENTSELIMLGHDDGRRSYISPASERLLGFAPDELAAMRLRDYVHPDDLKILYEATARLGRGETQVAVAYRSLHKIDGWIWVEGNFRRIPGATGDAPTIVATFRDIRERRRHQAEIEAAKDAAELASRAKTEFLATMSHEIRTPLNGVIGFTGLILDRTDLPADLRRQVELIRSSGSSLLTIVNDILDFSKIEAGEVELVPRPFSPASLVEEAVAILRRHADSNGTTITVALDPDLPPGLSGDADRLRQVLLNLLNNAVKFTRRGQVTVTVGCPVVEGATSLRVAVADTGVGIPEDKLGRLFQRFSQVDSSVQREFGGTGLGLAISKRLVELMGGEIGVESVQGRGSTFRFAVPLPPAALAPPALERVAGPRTGRRGRILVVDDIAMNLEIARAVLEAAGHAVDEATDGADAITAVERTAYDLVLMDVQMPVIDGITATRQIRSLPSPYGTVPVLAMTANVLPAQVAALLEAGMNGHVGKPFKREELLAAVDQVLAAAEPGAATCLTDRSAATDAVRVASEPVLDRETLAELTEMLSPSTVHSLLLRLAEQIEGGALIGPGPWEPNVLKREAHALVSSAGLLGFARLSSLCKDLERAIEAGDPADFAHRAVAAACREVLDTVATEIHAGKSRAA
jgi:PAS domain S-box-containing protein